MKKISKELLKTYYWVIILFAVFSIFIIVNFSVYLWKENQNDIKVIEEFIDYQMGELANKEDVEYISKELLFKNILDKAPKLRDVYLEIFYNDKKYAKSPYLPEKEHNFLDYYSVTKVYQIKDFNKIRVKITRRNVRDRLLILNAFVSFIFFLLFCLYIIVRIQKRFFDKFKNSLDNLKIFTQDYNLDSEIRIHSEENFIEFSILQKSFKNMLIRLKEQSQLQIDFVNNASHELKTPIALIQGYAEGLNEGMCEDKDSRKYYTDVIIDEANRMNSMVKQLLSLSVLESGSMELQKETFDIYEMVAALAESTKILAADKNVEFKLEGSSGILINADEFKLEEVVTNYISNAIKHVSDNGRIEIRLIPDEDRIKLEVYNTGSAIPKEDIEHIWDKFYKVDKAHSRDYGGTGIGLSIVKAILEIHDMPYGVENVDDGVMFWFEAKIQK